ncbi:uncharacterized protein LOC129300542 [Prosopis cineraria]|uniref:uncharacterized protein LOC129300542 n=1 Tax=Prosopis cineraria TaxID=364024 RepID=UPI00240EBE2D|nr:uncharacterized protein LOC129300542 [Prosopis cineraria]
MEFYLSKMTVLLDNMALAGCLIPLLDLIVQTLTKLNGDYTFIVVHLADKEGLSWIGLQSSLLTFEQYLEHLYSVNNDPAWYMDSGASNSVTNQASNISGTLGTTSSQKSGKVPKA